MSYIEASRGVGTQSVTVNATNSGFDSHSIKLNTNMFLILKSSFATQQFSKIRRKVGS